VSAAIRPSPAHWAFWNSTDSLADLGLIRPQPDGSSSPSLPKAGDFPHDGQTDSVAVQD